MNYLFFDLEYATSRNGLSKICEYGYVITNEKFEVIKRGNLIINPNINKKQWDIQVVNDILTRSIEEYELYPKFDYYYYQIDSMIKKADYIIGHTLSGDANALNNECRRYNKDSINYVFYDIKEFYKQYKNSKDSTSVTNILKELNIKGEGKKHDAESDAYNTMLELKEMLHNLDLTFEELCELVPEAKDETINFSVKSLEKVLDEKISRIINVNKNGNGLHRYKNRNNYIKFRQFLDNVKPNGALSNTFVNKVVLISLVYQENHFIQMLNLVQLIVNNSGSVTLKHKNANVYVKYNNSKYDKITDDILYDDIMQDISDGQKIEIITFEELLKRLKITEDELNAMPIPPFDFLLNSDAIIKNEKTRRLIDRKNNKNKIGKEHVLVYSSKPSSLTIGDLLLEKMQKENNK